MSTVSEALTSEEVGAAGGRTVAGIVNSIETLEGGGFLVRRPFPKAAFSDFDPFLLLDDAWVSTLGEPATARQADQAALSRNSEFANSERYIA